MDISVVIPMYNAQDTIIETVNSVLAQTYKGSFEIIVVNDGSTDDSSRILNNYIKSTGFNNIILINKENGGVASARNAGLKKAKGDWIALLDSDDSWIPEKLEIQMNILNNHKNIDFLGCNRNNEKTRVLWKKKDELSKITFKELLIKMYPQTSTAIFRRSIISEIGLYDESLRYAEDGDYWFRISQKKEMYFIPESLVITGEGKPNFGHSGLTSHLWEMHEGNIKIIHKQLIMGNINHFEFMFLVILYQLKYFRRILIVKLRKAK